MPVSARAQFQDGSGAGARTPLAGTPQQIVDDIRRYQDAGVVELRLSTAATAIEEVRSTWERFVDEVRPKVG